MEGGGGVQNLLSDLFSLFEIEDPGTDFLDFWEIFWYSSNRALLRAASEGPVKVVVLASSASVSFWTLEGVTPSLELLAMV